MCGSGEESASRPHMSKKQKRLAAAVEGLFYDMVGNVPEYRSALAERLGYSYGDDGRLTPMERPEDELMPEYVGLMNDLLSGEGAASPLLEKNLEDEEARMRETYARKLGTDYENSTVWNSAYDKFQQRKELLREEVRKGLMTNVAGFINDERAADQAGTINLANFVNNPVGSGLLLGGTQLQQPYQFMQQLRSNVDMFNANQHNSMIMGSSQQVSNGMNTAMSSGSSAGSSACCFIFIAGHGFLHPVVRKYRDGHMTVRNRRGYYWLSDRLVPKMKKHKWIKNIVKLFMIDPMTSYGKYYYGLNKIGAVFAPITQAWLLIFSLIGCRKPYMRQGTTEVV